MVWTSCLTSSGEQLNPKEAVLNIWTSRAAAREKQIASGKEDAGLRSEVTSGGHLDEVAQLVADAFVDAGIPRSSVYSGRSKLELPGYFRAEKQWDIVVVYKGQLVAAVELKCIASSYGNNMNNRAEEAMGNAVDLAQSIKNGLVGSAAPWLGYVFVIRDEEKSQKPVKVVEPHFSVDPAFKNQSYQGRAQILCSRLAMERLYDKAWFVTADPVAGTVNEPDPEMSWAKFAAAIKGKVGEVLA